MKNLKDLKITTTRKLRLDQLRGAWGTTAGNLNGEPRPVVLLGDGTVVGHGSRHIDPFPHIWFEIRYAEAWIRREIGVRERAAARREIAAAASNKTKERT